MMQLETLRDTANDFLKAALDYSTHVISPPDNEYWRRANRYKEATEKFSTEVCQWDGEIHRHLSTLMDEWELVVVANIVQKITRMLDV
jgi:hypothetical protein